MIFVLGIALIVLGAGAYAVSRGQQRRLTDKKSVESHRKLHYRFNVPEDITDHHTSRQLEISGLYLKMRAKFSKDERALRILKGVAFCSMAAGTIAVIAGLLVR
jgi:hypothetical protein